MTTDIAEDTGQTGSFMHAAAKAGHRTEGTPVSSARTLGRYWRFAKRFLGLSTHLEGQDGKKFIETLQARYIEIKGRERSGGEHLKNTHDIIDAIFGRYTTGFNDWDDSQVWSDGFAVERLLATLIPDEEVAVELEQRIERSRNHGRNFVEFYEKKIQPEDSSDQKHRLALNRILLVRLIDDMQWSATQNYLRRGYASIAQKRVSWTFLVAMVVFASVLVEHIKGDPSKEAAAVASVPSDTMKKEPVGTGADPSHVEDAGREDNAGSEASATDLASETGNAAPVAEE